MCRFAAYLGPETQLNQLLLDSDHSLQKQSWQPRELKEAVLNADGFGIGWYNDGGQPARYRQVLPIWNDPNLLDFSNSLQRPLWMATVRSATPGLGTHLFNTQPFVSNNWLFMHNGYILDFANTARGKIRKLISHELEANIHGNTDSEYLFALFLHFLSKTGDAIKAITDCFKQLQKWLGPERALLNILLSDGVQIIATRHAINGDSPSLYYGKNIDDFPDHSQLIVSERLNTDDNWQRVDEHSIIRLRPGPPVEIIAL